MQYITSSSGNDGTCVDHRHVRHHAQPRRRRRRRAEPHLAGGGAAAERGEAGRHLGDQGVDQLRPRRRGLRREGRVRHAVHQQLRRPLRQGRDQARARRRRRHRLRHRPLRDAAVARSRQARRAATSPPTKWCRRCASRTCRWRPGRSARRRRATGQTFQISVRAAGRLTEPSRVREHHPQAIGRRRAGPRARTSAASSSAPKATPRRRAINGRDAVGFGVLQLPTANALQVYRDVERGDRAAVAALPAGAEDRDRVRHDDASSPNRSARS